MDTPPSRTVPSTTLQVAGLAVEVIRKPIKHLHLAVHPPDGRVRVSSPERLDDAAVRLAVIDRLAWIRRQRDAYAEQPRQSARAMVSGECHYAFGQRYRLNVIHRTAGPNVVVPRLSGDLDLVVRPSATAAQREATLYEWYRGKIKARLPGLIAEWEPVLGVSVAEWGVKRMRTKWGTCSPTARRIWVNVELAKKPLACLEFVVVHEMAHLIEPTHSARFTALMDGALPDWRVRRAVLNTAPLADEVWPPTEAGNEP